MQENKWAKAAVLALLFFAVAAMILYLAGYFYLWSIRQSVLKATPLTVFQYWIYFPHVHKALIVCLAGAAALVIVPVILLALPKRRSLHGDARFATWQEIQASNLTGDHGLIIGCYSSYLGFVRRYLLLPGQLGILLAAPPRSGKGAGIVNTNMLNWPDSAVVLDIRQESWRVTSGYRQEHGQQCFLFNPVAEDARSCQWNPLSYVSEDPVLRINDIQKIGNMLSPNAGEKDPFWPSSCRTLFLGLALYLFETPGLRRTFGEIVRQIMFGEGESVGDHWKKIIEAREKGEHPLSQTCKSALYDFIYTSANTQSSIRKTFTSKLELWLNPLVDAATCSDSFDLRKLRQERISIYIGILPGDIDRLQIILNLFFQQIVDLNTREMPEDNPALKHECLLMMDEFTAMGKMSVLEKAVSYLGGYNLRLAIIIQTPAQLRSVYGVDGAKTIIDCMGAQIVFAPKDNQHAQDISETLGYETVKAKSQSHGKQLLIGKASPGSINTSDHKRALLMPQEVREIGKNKQIIFIENVKPILCNKIRYFEDPVFTGRLRPPVRVNPLIIEMPARGVGIIGHESSEGGGSAMHMSGNWRELREVIPEDIIDGRLDEMTAKDFGIDVANINLPKEAISDEDMKTAVDAFLASMSA